MNDSIWYLERQGSERKNVDCNGKGNKSSDDFQNCWIQTKKPLGQVFPSGFFVLFELFCYFELSG